MAYTAEGRISVSELRERLKDVLSGANKGQRFTVRQNSREVAVIVGVDEWRMLNETLDILLDRNMVEQITRSERAIDEGRTRSADDVLGEIERELDADGE